MHRLPPAMFLLLLVGPALVGSPAEAVTAAAVDVVTLPKEDRCNQLYAWHPSNDEKEVKDFAVILKYRINRASVKYARMFDPHPIAVKNGHGQLWRVDIEELGWKRKVIDRAEGLESYFYERQVTRPRPRLPAMMRAMRPSMKTMRMMTLKVMKTRERAAAPIPELPAKALGVLLDETAAKAPIVHAEWLLWRLSTQLSLQNQDDGLGYYNILGIGKRADYFELVGLDEKLALRKLRELRAALAKSKLTGIKGRQLGELDTLQGPTWFTLDTDNPSGKGVAVGGKNLKRGAYNHKAEEWFGHLNNGLVAEGLFNKDGTIQNTAPDFIGQNTSKLLTTTDRRIHPGRCRSCHQEVLLPFNDYVRSTFDKDEPKRFDTKQERLEFENQYFRDIDGKLKLDVALYARAEQLATVTKHTPKGLALKEIAALDVEVLERYSEQGVSLARAAAEVGCTPAELKQALDLAHGTIDGVDDRLAPFRKVPPRAITRIIHKDALPKLRFYLRGVKP